MKLNKILMVLAATAIVGCTSEDLNDFNAKQAPEDSRLIELNSDFALAGVGVDGAMTRTHWERDAVSGALVNKFLPIYKSAADGFTGAGLLSANADVLKQAVGLCWLGQVPGAEVYTNYQFYHFGWLNNDQTEADYACGTLYNGSLYSDVTISAGTAEKEAKTTDWGAAGLLAKSKDPVTGLDNLNYNSGVYKTENKAIFGGQYIVYYPFNPDFKEAGTIPAKAKTLFDWDIATAPANPWEAPELGDATFRYSAPVTIEGGDEAANFGLYNLSTLVRLRVACPAGDANATDVIDQIVLYSPSEKLLKQANLAADKIVEGKKGAELYASSEGTKTITTNFVTTATTPALDVKATTQVSAYITVLPTTVDDLVALVHNKTKGTWARVAIPTTEFKAGGATALEITAAAADFKTEFIAVDDASLRTALTNANTAAATNPATITLIGDIELAADLTIDQTTYGNIKNVTITDGAIIVPEGKTLTLKSFTMESDIRVLGTSCCSGALAGGALVVDVEGTNETVINNVTMVPSEARVKVNPTVTYSGAATVAEGAVFDAQAGTVNVNAAVQHKAAINIGEEANVTVNAGGDLQFMGSTVTNDGTIEVKKNGKFDITDKDGNASATDGKNMTNNGKFIHNVDAGVGTAVQEMKQNGEYRCRVDDQIKLDDAFLQWTACSVIEMVNAAPVGGYNLGTAKGITPAAYKHNGKYIDIEVNTTGVTTFNNPGATNGDNENINVRNLTVTAGGLDIVYVKGTGKRTLTVNGNMAVKDNTTITSSKLIDVKENLTVEGAGVTLTYEGDKANVDGLAVAKDITVSKATFDAGAGTAASDVDALNITCANFYLKDAATATFGNRNDGAGKNLVVSGTISNPAGCTFNIVAANQVGASVLAWVTCTKLEVGGNFSAARPRVVAAE